MAPVKKRAPRGVSSPFVVASPRGPTARQRGWLQALAELAAELGRAPNATELAEHTGVSRFGARRALRALAAKGLTQDVPKVVSSGQWAVTAAGQALLAQPPRKGRSRAT